MTLLDQIKTRIKLVITKAIIDAIDDSGEVQILRVSSLEGEEISDIERLQDYGLSTVPPVDSGCVIGSIGGNRDNSVSLSTGAPSGRPKGKSSGNVTLWDIHGNKIELVDGKILVTGAEVNINNGTKGIARLDDTTQVQKTITVGTISLLPTTGDLWNVLDTLAAAVNILAPGAITQLPDNLDGTITSSSDSVKAGN